MPYLIAFLLLAAVVWFLSDPLRRGAGEQVAAATAQRLELEAARDAKLGEIRDAALDHQTGKLSDDDYEAIDSGLRTEAVELLHRIDAIDDERSADAE